MLDVHIKNGDMFSTKVIDACMDGLQLSINKKKETVSIGQQGTFQLQFLGRSHLFPFEITRITPEGFGILITQDLDHYGEALLDGVFGNVF